MKKKIIIGVSALVVIAAAVILTLFLTGVIGKKANFENSYNKEPLEDIRTVYIYTDAKINKDEKVPGKVVILDTAKQEAYADDVYDAVEGDVDIKIRGNSTSGAKKAPYNITFPEKTDLFGMGAAKKWCLLSNPYEKSMLRIRTALELARGMGLAYTPESTYVDLYLNDEYRGNYLLTEAITDNKNRVDIDTSKGDILLEKEWDRYESGKTYMKTKELEVRFVISEPENVEESSDIYQNTLSKLNHFEDCLIGGNYTMVKDMIDVDSFVNFYIVNELYKNVDFNYSSTRFYIKDGIIYAGPTWDLDLSSGNANPGFYTSYFVNGETYTELWCQQFMWFKLLMQMPAFEKQVAERYEEVQPMIENIINGDDKNSINDLVKTYGGSFARNCASKNDGGAGWSVSIPEESDVNSYAVTRKWQTYEETVEYFRDWLKKRNEYLKGEFGLKDK